MGRVRDYFERFLAAFPDVAALADADEDQALRLWEGLGYYRRARQLHKAARVIVAKHGGRFPRDRDAVLALPGIGRYTAGAILSIAFDAREPILEANSTRVLCRLLAFREDPTRAEGQRLLWSFAESLLPTKHVGTFNQALMELGSRVCTPLRPLCDACPVAPLCPTRASGLQDVVPLPKRKTRYQQVREAAVVVRRRGRILLRRCAPGERWAGLWDFPRFAVRASRGAALHKELIHGTEALAGVRVEPGKRLTTLRHGVTRFRITLVCHEAEYVSSSNRPGGNGTVKWVTPTELEAYPLSATGRRISQLVTAEPTKKQRPKGP